MSASAYGAEAGFRSPSSQHLGRDGGAADAAAARPGVTTGGAGADAAAAGANQLVVSSAMLDALKQINVSIQDLSTNVFGKLAEHSVNIAACAARQDASEERVAAMADTMADMQAQLATSHGRMRGQKRGRDIKGSNQAPLDGLIMVVSSDPANAGFRPFRDGRLQPAKLVRDATEEELRPLWHDFSGHVPDFLSMLPDRAGGGASKRHYMGEKVARIPRLLRMDGALRKLTWAEFEAYYVERFGGAPPPPTA